MCLWGSLLVDLVRRSPDEAERIWADDMLGLITPVIKGYLTDKGFAAAVHAQQVLGGHGYIREHGIEQFVRDARITQIYEGTNGIQAMDLVGRKLPKDGGRAVRTFFETVSKDVADAKAAGDPAGIAAALEAALADLQAATMWLAQNGMADPNNAGAGAYAYMDLMGLVSLGWMWLKMAAAADAALKGDAKEGRDFYEAKLVTARFYAQRELPMTECTAAEDRGGRGKPDGVAGRSLLARFALVHVPGPEHRDVVRALLLGRKPAEVEHVVELDSELAGLRPADAAGDRADPDDIDGQLGTGRHRNRAFDERAHCRDVAELDLADLAVDLGDRPAHEAMPRLADALKAVGLDGGAVGQFPGGLSGSRAAEDVTLDLAAAELPDQVEIVVRLHALGGRIHAKRLGERDDGADDRAVAVRGRRGAANEALVDLDLVERRFLQIAERAVAGAEIVERQPHPELL